MWLHRTKESNLVKLSQALATKRVRGGVGRAGQPKGEKVIRNSLC